MNREKRETKKPYRAEVLQYSHKLGRERALRLRELSRRRFSEGKILLASDSSGTLTFSYLCEIYDEENKHKIKTKKEGKKEETAFLIYLKFQTQIFMRYVARKHLSSMARRGDLL